MRAVILLLMLIGSSTQGATIGDGLRTIVAADLVGEWRPDRGLDEPMPSISEMTPYEIALIFGDSSQTRMTRRYPDGGLEETQAGPSRSIGNLHYWSFRREDGLVYELVLGGWGLRGGTKVLFGYLYLVSKEDGLFNGWSVAVQPANGS
jgi:hypothetical protein